MAGPESATPVEQITTAVRSGEWSARQVASDCLARIASAEDRLKAFLHVDEQDVREQADAIDARIQRGETDGALLGVPVAIKDNLCVRDLPTTCGSRILAGYRPPYDAEVVSRLRAAGALIIGKTNLDEFAMGASTESSAFQQTSNPHDLQRVPGGSSGGSAAAVAAGLVPVALGSDTGGSVRQPAAFCGVVGHRPTYGSVSRRGLVAFASSLDQVGPLTFHAADAARVLEVIRGADPGDSTCTVDLLGIADSPARVEKLRIGLPAQYWRDDVQAEIREALGGVRDLLEGAGAELVPIDLPLTDHAIATYYLLVTSEASSNLARFDGIRYGPREPGAELADVYRRTRARFGDEVKRRILLGTFALSAGYYDAYYKKALNARREIQAEFARAFERADLLLTPTTPTTAFLLGEKTQDPLELYLCDVFTAPSALAGIAAVSVPVGKDAAGLPIGAQLLAAPRRDHRALAVARWVQSRVHYSLDPVKLEARSGT
jgi:aspartyl-tRNA(Asn)/glutamyl-tRNA(Gln) amidotransferase subunit A